MTLLQSKPLPLLTKCPDFSLPSVTDAMVYTLRDFSQSKALLIAFICNHCPYVRAIEDRLLALKHRYAVKDFAMVGICANDSENYPSDSVLELKKRWQEKKYGFPYLIDKDQTVARAFGAVCTPDLFLFDHARQLFYHGQLDDNWQYEAKVIKQDLKEAIDAILNDNPPPKDQKPSIGCSIKWR
jgi:peroxiredoxin